jgi:hypothetical protein
LISIKANRAVARSYGTMDRMNAAAARPRFEMAQIGRTLDDLTPGEQLAPRPGGDIAPVIWTAVGAFALVAFLGALLAL